GITSITVKGKAAYELKGKFLNDLHDNAFSGTKGEDAVEHIEYFLKIVDPIDLPNVNYELLRLAIFSISLVGKFYRNFGRKVDNKEGVTNKGFSDHEEANNNDEHKIAEIFRIKTNLFDYETPTKTYEDYKSELNNKVGEPWSRDGVPYEICDQIYEPFRLKKGKTKWPTCNSNKDGFYSGLKEEALKQKAIYEKSWGDASQRDLSQHGWRMVGDKGGIRSLKKSLT
ncbi:hypothetical protein Tco_1355565, partial [Tanacetum coccineum]